MSYSQAFLDWLDRDDTVNDETPEQFQRSLVEGGIGALPGWDSDDDTPVGTQTVKSAQLTLNDAQIKALPTTELTLVASPGTGKMLWPVAGMLICDTTANEYGNINGGAIISIGYEKTGMTNYLADGPLAFMFDGSPGAEGSVSGLIGAQTIALASLGPMAFDLGGGAVKLGYNNAGNQEPWEDCALVIGASNLDGDFNGGDSGNYLLVAVQYIEVTLPTP